MEWSDYLKKLIEDENNFAGITLSLDGGANVIEVPPIIRASIFMLDKCWKIRENIKLLCFLKKLNQHLFFR